MIVRAISDEMFITTQEYVLMIATTGIFTYLSRVYRSIHAFSSRDAKETKKIYFMHIFNVSSMRVYRLGHNGSRLDITAVIT